MKTNIIKISLISLVSFVILVFFLALSDDKKYSTEKLIGKKIANFEIKHFFKDETYNQNNLINEGYHLINIWASWCLPCKQEHPILMKLKSEKKLKLVGINFKDKKGNATKFLKEMENPYDILLIDPDGTKSVIFGVFGVPESILINNEKIVIKKFIGPLSKKDYTDIVKLINAK